MLYVLVHREAATHLPPKTEAMVRRILARELPRPDQVQSVTLLQWLQQRAGAAEPSPAAEPSGDSTLLKMSPLSSSKAPGGLGSTAACVEGMPSKAELSGYTQGRSGGALGVS